MDEKDLRPKCLDPPLATLEVAEREAIGKVIDRCRPELERWFLEHGAFGWEVDFAVADTYAKVWSGLSLDVRTLRDAKNVKAVVLRAAPLVMLEIRQGRKHEARFHSINAKHPPQLASANDPHAIAQLRELERAFDAACASLPPQQREILLLWRRDYGYAEIAEHMGISVNSVKTQLKRSKRAVRERLHDEGFDAGGEDDDDNHEGGTSTDSSEHHT